MTLTLCVSLMAVQPDRSSSLYALKPLNRCNRCTLSSSVEKHHNKSSQLANTTSLQCQESNYKTFHSCTAQPIWKWILFTHHDIRVVIVRNVPAWLCRGLISSPSLLLGLILRTRFSAPGCDNVWRWRRSCAGTWNVDQSRWVNINHAVPHLLQCRSNLIIKKH